MNKDIEYYKDNPFEVEWDDINQDNLDEGIFDGKPKVQDRLEAAKAFAGAFDGKGGELDELAKKLKEYAKSYELSAGKVEANKKIGLKDKASEFKLMADAYLTLLDNCLVDAVELVKKSPKDPKTDLITDKLTKMVKWKKTELNAEQKAAVEKADKAAAEKAEQEKRISDYASKMINDKAAADDKQMNDKFAKMTPYYIGSKVKVGSSKPKDEAFKGISDSIASHLENMKGNFAIMSSEEKQMIAVAMFGTDANAIKRDIVADLNKDGVECTAAVKEHTWPGYPFTHVLQLANFKFVEQQEVALQMA